MEMVWVSVAGPLHPERMAQVARAAAVSLRHLQFKHFLSPQTTTSVPHRLFFFTRPSHRSYAHPRSRGLRLPREPHLVEEETAAEKNDKKSRSEMKREARQAVRWAMDLASFSAPQIKRILKAASLEREVFEALMLVKRFGPDVREGKRRQFNYIGKLLRDAQLDLLGALIQATKDGDQSRFQVLASSVELVDEDLEEEFYESESELEYEVSSDHIILANKWFDGLVNKDIQITNEVYSVDEVEFDRQELRRLVRKVHCVQDRQSQSDEGEKSFELTAAEKLLNRFLCSLAKSLTVLKSQSAIV